MGLSKLIDNQTISIDNHHAGMTIRADDKGLHIHKTIFDLCSSLTPDFESLIKFLFVEPDFCLRLPSDLESPPTPLSLAMCFPLLGRTRDMHPLDYAHVGRTTSKSAN